VSLLALLAPLAAASTDRVPWAVRPGLGRWWLPYNYAQHGHAMDSLFDWIFWICTIVFIAVQFTIVYFIIKYRSRPETAGRKAKFIHGNTKLEMVWTLIPAVILAVIALASKAVWDHYRYAEDYDHSKQTEVLVIGEQFKWNFVYPGKDGKLGQYLAFPRPSDPKFRGKPYLDAMSAIKRAILDNPLGQNKQFDDPHNPDAKYGADDDYDPNPGRPLILPVDRPIAVNLSSKDVIHDFYMPNFRVKLDALPGMAGRLNFTAEAPAQSTQELSIDDPQLIGKPIWIDSATPNAQYLPNDDVSQINYSLNDKAGQPIVRGRDILTAKSIAALKTAGVKKVVAVTRPFELVCEELCGQGHSLMRAEVFFVSGAQYDRFIAKDDPKNTLGGQKPNITDRGTGVSPVSSAAH
jgi:heme/copper-type cytochrome/quinol oxidase subunit 2